MMTKYERTDLLLDAIGFIGEDIVAEASGVSEVIGTITLPSRVKLNLRIMRRLLAATLCFLIISALMPVSVYLYNAISDYYASMTLPSDTTEETLPDTSNSPESDKEADSETVQVKIPIIDSMSPYGDDNIRDLFHNDYKISGAEALKNYPISVRDGDDIIIREICPVIMTHRETGKAYLYFDIRNAQDGIVDYKMSEGINMLFISKSKPSKIFIFSTRYVDPENFICRLQYNVYTVSNGKFEEVTSNEIDVELIDSNSGIVLRFFQTMLDALGKTSDWQMYIDQYTMTGGYLPVVADLPEITPGGSYWSMKYLNELYSVNPVRFTDENGIVYHLKPAGYEIVACVEEKIPDELVIPTEFNGRQVIRVSGLSSCPARKIIIPAGIAEIGQNAFSQNQSLQEVIIESNSDTVFGDWIFYMCPSLTSVTFTGECTELSQYIFANCDALTQINLPKTLITINDSAFSFCKTLKTVALPESLRFIGDKAFDGCSMLQELSIPDGVTNIQHAAFRNCVSLKSIILPQGITYLAEDLFYNAGIEELTIHEGVTAIYSQALYTGALRSVTIPASVETITQNYFFSIDTLESIYFGGTKEEWAKLYEHPSWQPTRYTVYCSDGKIKPYIPE